MNDKHALSFIEKSQYDGSDLYYSLLYQNKESKLFLSLLFAIEYELIQITTNIQDLGIARQKLQWWQEELLRCKENQARHPVTKFLATEKNFDTNMIDNVLHSIINCQSLLVPYHFETCNDFIALYKTNFGALWNTSTSFTNLSSLTNLELIGACRYFLYVLSKHHLLQQQGREVMPASISIFDSYEFIIQSLQQVDIPKSDSVLRYAQIMRDLLLIHCETAIRKQDEHFLGITPLRKLFHVWYIRIS